MFPNRLAGGGVDADDLLAFVVGGRLVADDRVEPVLETRRATTGRPGLRASRGDCCPGRRRGPSSRSGPFRWRRDSAAARANWASPSGRARRRRGAIAAISPAAPQESSKAAEKRREDNAGMPFMEDHLSDDRNRGKHAWRVRERKAATWRVDPADTVYEASAALVRVFVAVSRGRIGTPIRRRFWTARPIGPARPRPCLLDKLYRQDTRVWAREPRPAGLTTGTTGSVSPRVAACKVTLTVALGPAPKNSSDRFEAAVDTRDVACEAPACPLRQAVCASTHRPGLNRAKDWLDW